MSTVKVINVVHPSSSTNNIVLDSSGNASSGGTLAMSSSFLRNRIINGAMVIDQRNAGASVTPSATASNIYFVDRWNYTPSQASKCTLQQVSTVPNGTFSKSISATVASAATIGASDYFGIAQKLEGFNIADFGFGTANAQSITLSFWVRSSVTGTYCAQIQNAGQNRSWIATYTISAANTWQYVTLAITGDTSGSWASDNTVGMQVWFDLGSGSNFYGTAGQWNASNTIRTSGSVNWIANAGATFYLTGVQLEVGSVATPFERRLYGSELALCQRYFQAYGVASVTTAYASMCMIAWYSTTRALGTFTLPVPMRAIPTLTNNNYKLWLGGSPISVPTTINCFGYTPLSSGVYVLELDMTVASGTASNAQAGQFKAENNTAASVTLSAEL